MSRIRTGTLPRPLAEAGGPLIADSMTARLGSAEVLQSKGEIATSDTAICTAGQVTLCATKSINAMFMAVMASDVRLLHKDTPRIADVIPVKAEIYRNAHGSPPTACGDDGSGRMPRCRLA